MRVWASGLCFALCAFVTDDDPAGVRPRRRASGRAATGTDVFTALDRPGRPLAAPLRRLHRPRRHRADVPRLRRQGFKQEEQALLKPGAGGRRSATSPSGTMRCASRSDAQKQMVTGHVTVLRGRQGDRAAESGALVLRQARGRADDRGRDPPRLAEDLYIVLADLRRGDADGDLRRHGQPAGELDLVRLRRAGVRHGHRAAAGRRFAFAGAQVPAGAAGDDDVAPAAVTAAAAHRSTPSTSTTRATCPTSASRGHRSRRTWARSSACAAAAAASASAIAAAPRRRGMRAEVAEAARRRQDPRGGLPAFHRASTAARNCWPRRSTGLQPPGLAVPVSRRRTGAVAVASSPGAGPPAARPTVRPPSSALPPRTRRLQLEAGR